MTAMRRLLPVIALSGLGAVIAAVVWLSHQGLDRAGQWVTVAGFFVSGALGIASVVVGWLTYRQAAAAPAGTQRRDGQAQPAQLRATASGNARVYQAGRDLDLRDR